MNTIIVKGDLVRKEGEASAAITPGDLIEFGGAADVQVHSTVGGAARRAFALENEPVGKGVDDAYAAGDTVQYGVFYPGAEVYARLSAGETCSKGDALESAGNGRLQVSSSAVAGSIVAWALAAGGAGQGGSGLMRAA